MKQKTKRIISMILIFVLIFTFVVPLLAGCGNTNDKEANTQGYEETLKEETQTKDEESILKTEETENIEETTEKEPETYTVDLVAVGDNLIHSMVISAGKQEDGTYNYDSMYENIKDEISDFDVKIINQETMLVENSSDYSGYPTFGSPYAIGDAVIKAGFNVVTHATNHAYDKGEKGVLNTTKYWKEHPEVLMTGVYDSQEAFDTISIMEVNNIKIAFLNYTYSLNGFKLPSEKQYLVNTLYSEDKIKEDLAKANELADFVIVLPHWGNEYQYVPSDYQISWARCFIDNGADLIIGAHPHVVQPMEYLLTTNGKEVPCYFSLGNFISNQDEVPRMLGAMAKVTIEMTEGKDAKIVKSEMEPIITHIDSNRKGFTTYMLKDYTNELALEHYLTKIGKTVSVEGLQRLYDSIINNY